MKDINTYFSIYFLSFIKLTTILPKRNHSLRATSLLLNQTQKPKQVKKHKIRITKKDSIQLSPIENQKSITWPKSLSPNLSILVPNSKYKILTKG